MTPTPRIARPAGSPAYYLGRPASWWIAARRQRHPPDRRRPAGALREAAGAPVDALRHGRFTYRGPAAAPAGRSPAPD